MVGGLSRGKRDMYLKNEPDRLVFRRGALHLKVRISQRYDLNMLGLTLCFACRVSGQLCSHRWLRRKHRRGLTSNHL